MKKLFFSLLIATAIVSCQKDDVTIDDNSATLKSTTVSSESALKNAVKNAKAGDNIVISGTIKLTSTLKLQNSGSSSSKIYLSGGTLDCSGISGSSRGVKLTGSHWHVSNMTIKNAADNGLVVEGGGNNTIHKVNPIGNKDTGIQIYNGAHDMRVTFCYSKDNYDSGNGGENADGFACKLSGGKNNMFNYCTADHNSDDGWDMYEQPYTVKITNCTAKNNGYGSNGDGNGFKLGSSGQNVPHTVTNCTATNNTGYGYTGNGNKGHMTTTGSGGSGNKKGLWDRMY